MGLSFEGTHDLEGIVAKHKLGIYKDDGNSWLKIKNPHIPRPRAGTNFCGTSSARSALLDKTSEMARCSASLYAFQSVAKTNMAGLIHLVVVLISSLL